MTLKKTEISLLQAVFVARTFSCFLCILRRLRNQTALDRRYLEILGTCSFTEHYLYDIYRCITCIYNLFWFDNYIIQTAFNES